MDIPLELSMEQEFSLRAYEDQVKHLDPVQAQEMLLEVLRQLMLKENVIKHLLQQSYGEGRLYDRFKAIEP
jgi:hypothetical protein